MMVTGKMMMTITERTTMTTMTKTGDDDIMTMRLRGQNHTYKKDATEWTVMTMTMTLTQLTMSTTMQKEDYYC